MQLNKYLHKMEEKRNTKKEKLKEKKKHYPYKTGGEFRTFNRTDKKKRKKKDKNEK